MKSSATRTVRRSTLRLMAEEWRQLVGEAIRARRHELGIGPMEFAGELHVSVKTVERYERGESDGALRQLDEIAKVLRTTPEALTTSAGERAERGDTPDVLDTLTGRGPYAEQLDHIEELLEEVLKRLPPARDDDVDPNAVPDRLPDAPGEDGQQTGTEG